MAHNARVAFLYDILDPADPALHGACASIPSTAAVAQSSPAKTIADEAHPTTIRSTVVARFRIRATERAVGPSGPNLLDSDNPKAPTLPISPATTTTRPPRLLLRRPRLRRPPPTTATMQAAALRRHLLDQHHLSPASSAAISAFRSAAQPAVGPQGLGGADGARYFSARTPAVKGAGHLVRKGTGGRSSVSGIVATVFGATGFLGRYVVQQLAKMGSQVLVPFRGCEDSHRHLKLMGDLGQIVPMKYNPRDVNSIKTAVAKSNVVINLIGREFETRNYGFEEVNHHMAEQLAMISKEHGGIVRFIQVSALGASASSPSRLLQAKAAGEESVLKEFPEATIMRPATLIGTEDRILNRWAMYAKNWGFLPLVGGGSTKFQPVYVVDVAAAIVNSLKDDGTSMGKTYELGGPDVYTIRDLAEMMFETIREYPRYVNLPFPIARAIATPRELLLNKVPFPLPTPSNFNLDQINALSVDNLVSENALTFSDLEIKPHKLKGYPTEFLVSYRKGGPSFGSTISEKMGSADVAPRF